MVAGEHLRKPDHIAIALSHLLPVDRDHIIMDPIPGRYVLITDIALRDLAFVVGEHEVHPAAVNVELDAKIFGAHGGAFDMPTGETLAPWALPTHDVLGRCGFPKREVLPVVLFLLTIEIARGLEEVIKDAPTQFTIGIMRCVLFDVKVDRAIDDIGIPIPNDCFDHADLFNDMTGGGRLDTGIEIVELTHGPMEEVGAFLHQLHRFKLLDRGLFGDLVLRLPALFFKMAGIGDIADITDLIAEMKEV